MCTCIYDSYNLPKGLFGSYGARLGNKLNLFQPGLVVVTISSTNGSTLSDSGILITTRCASLWFSFYSNLTLILDDSLGKYILHRI